jgi:hypothetical protein
MQRCVNYASKYSNHLLVSIGRASHICDGACVWSSSIAFFKYMYHYLLVKIQRLLFILVED